MAASPISDKWLKASVLAGLWAGIEIIAGSFLHNLRIPLSGSFLTMISIILVLGFFQIWPQRGIMWRAGLITALMKSISPSAVILGPMTAIFAEGLLLEIAVAVLGRNLIGYITGGAITLLSALMHKIIRLWLMYGLDIFEIYESMFRLAVDKVGFRTTSPVAAVAWLFITYALLGAVSAYAGYALGKKARYSQRHGSALATKNIDKDGWNQQPEGTKYAFPLLIVHVLAIPLLLVLPQWISPGVAAGLSLPYLLFAAWRYPHAMRKLQKSLFWMQLLAVLVLAWFFSDAAGGSRSVGALLDGVQMVLRALLVVMGFSALSTELRAPVMQRIFYQSNLRQLYLAINTAFGILPEVVEHFAKPREFLKNPLGSIAGSLKHVNNWYRQVASENQK